MGKQDPAVAILTIFLSVALLKHIYKKNAGPIDFVYAMLIAFFTFQIKVSGVFIFLLLVFSLFQVILNKTYKVKEIFYYSTPTLIISLFWFTKSFLTSGCLIFPVSITCNKNLKWYEAINCKKTPTETTLLTWNILSKILILLIGFKFFGLV